MIKYVRLQLIDRVVRKFLGKQYLGDKTPSGAPRLPVFVILPYLGVFSMPLEQLLMKFLKKIYTHVDFGIVVQASRHMVSFSPLRIVSQSLLLVFCV